LVAARPARFDLMTGMHGEWNISASFEEPAARTGFRREDDPHDRWQHESGTVPPEYTSTIEPSAP